MASQISPASMPNASVASSKPPGPAKTASKSKPRKRVNTAEKRHQHNAIERARRETLNGKFIHLARLLPALANSRRPSKSAIVNGSIAHLSVQREERLLAVQLLRKVCADHDALLNEVNDWRTHAGYPAKDSKPVWTEQMETLTNVEKEVFGTFANYEGGDDDNDDDADAMDSNDQSSVQDHRPLTAATAVSLDTGLVTPRTSLDSLSNQNIFANMSLPTPGLGGINWPHDFAADLSSQQRNLGAMSFPNFLADNVDRASTDSPAASQIGGMVMTPNTTADVNVFNTQTPSPRSTQSGSLHVTAEETKPVAVPPVPQGWAASQAMFFQQQQQQLQRLHSQQHMVPAQAPIDPRFDRMLPGCGNTFPMFPSPNNASAGNGQFTNQAFTQQLFASMFPNGNVPSSPHEQINQWRKNALGAMQPQAQGAGQMLSGAPSVDELRNAVRAGMGLGLGMSSLWPEGQQNAVEGF